MKKFNLKHIIILCSVLAFFVALDLVTKYITDGINIVLINNFLSFKSYHNTGASWGIFSNQTLMLTIISAVMVVLIFVYNYFHKNKTVFYTFSVALILSGAIGNLIDRIFLGYVRDFISFSFFNFIFNVADACLTVGVVMFGVYVLFLDKKTDKKVGKTYE